MRKIFMLYFSFIYNLFKKLFPINKNLIIFIDNNGLNNTKYLYEEIKKRQLNKKCYFVVKSIKKNYEYPIIFIGNPKAIFYLATSSFWIVYTHLHDFLKWKITPPQKCRYIQVWHASGAFKKFGQDSANEFIEEKEILKREKEYIDSIIVTSEICKNPFSTAFGVDKNKIKVLGNSRTDIFFDEVKKEEIRKKIKKLFPKIQNKKVILYAPTFRDNDLDNYKMKIDFRYLNKELGKNYKFIIIYSTRILLFFIKSSLYSSILSITKYLYFE